MTTQSIQQVGAQMRSEMANLARQAMAAPGDAISGNVKSPSDMSFGHAMLSTVEGVDNLQHAAEDKMEAVDSGKSDDLIGAMVASQEASLSFSMLTQVRNKLASAVDDLLKMQI
ncbi:flagellar hook-basal body complex protein FliE [Pandoraea pulmonicola]|uniref:Flagellar hook-basal body complex protein FliE n=1 Tax=Pandoraea pulmonicola TaxID=93221 RepID=A0AAJ4ZBB7_PANPU|nr:flagellar hook-basal body complex protein FliE [Pandoraea pulmonicola]AJC21214.1 flagellar hook-basal body protein FliE [Pandoraea pulmonicola]SUA90106.1 flagellar hook-basal body protein FliE [Pandoraea pulmonicola]